MAADKIVLATPRYKGEYPLDFDDPAPSALEWRWMKKISGYLPGTAADGLANSDPDLFIALAVIAMVRAGRIRRDDVYTVADELAELPVDGVALRYIGAAVDDTESPPPTAPATDALPANTGGSSNSTWGSQEHSPSLIGAPD